MGMNNDHLCIVNNNHEYLAQSLAKAIKTYAGDLDADDPALDGNVQYTAGSGVPASENRLHRVALGHVDFVGTWMDADFTYRETINLTAAEIAIRIKSGISEGVEIDLEQEEANDAANN
jgi:hypothetical protein